MQRAGGVAALYVAVAYVAAIPYFVLLVDYPGATDPITKVALLKDNFTSMYLMHVVCFQFVALAMIVVTVASYQRLKDRAPGTAQLAAAVGLIQAGLLLASVQVFNYGMDTVVQLFATAPEQAVSAWQVIESVAMALGGSGGQLVGGVWVLLVSVAALRAREFPAALNWLGAGIGTAGILSSLPALSMLEVAYELLMIVWFGWLGIALLWSARHSQQRLVAPEPGSNSRPVPGGGLIVDGLAAPPVAGDHAGHRYAAYDPHQHRALQQLIARTKAA
jgi:hypothetical protein